MTPEEHYARGLELLAAAERCTELYQVQANTTLAQGHFAAAVAGAALALRPAGPETLTTEDPGGTT